MTDRKIITPRLILRPYAENDADDFMRLHGDPDLALHTHAKALAHAASRELFDGFLGAFKADGFGMYRIGLRPGHGIVEVFVGECGLWHRADAGGYTLRYMIDKAHWSLGYSFEAVEAVLAHAFEVRGLSEIFAIAMQQNERSTRILLKAGFRVIEAHFRGVDGFLRFRLGAAEWRAKVAMRAAAGF